MRPPVLNTCQIFADYQNVDNLQRSLSPELGSFQILVKQTIFLTLTLSNYTKQVFCETPDDKHGETWCDKQRCCMEVLSAVIAASEVLMRHLEFIPMGLKTKKNCVSLKRSLLIWRYFAWKTFAVWIWSLQSWRWNINVFKALTI